MVVHLDVGSLVLDNALGNEFITSYIVMLIGALILVQKEDIICNWMYVFIDMHCWIA